jgi:hypothetical protein
MANKQISEIKIRQTKTSTLQGSSGEITDSALFLSEKIDEYLFKLGCSSAHTLGVVTQLLNVGKIRLDFRDYNERLQLINAADAMSRTDAMSLTEAYLGSVQTQSHQPSDLDLTQKVIIQAPKRSGF